jgi:hypothetical protein
MEFASAPRIQGLARRLSIPFREKYVPGPNRLFGNKHSINIAGN